MKRILSFLTTVILLLALVSTSLAKGSDTKPNDPDLKKTYLIAFHSAIDLKVIRDQSGKVKKQYKYLPVVAAELSAQAVQALLNNPKIDYLEEDAKVEFSGQVTPWGIPHVKATDVQQTGVTGSGVKVGILDTGIDYTHEDLQVAGGGTFVEGTLDYMDDNGHGTHVAGTVSSADNIVGVLGVAPQVNLYAIKVLDQYGNGNYSDIIAGIEWAIANDMDIINMSFGGSTSSRTLQKVVDKAYNGGILLISSAGNNGYDKKGSITYPAAYEAVIAVGAVDQQNKRVNFSSTGRQLELVAPGVGILSTVPGGYGYESGTSMASAHVAGVAALVWQDKPTLSNVQVRNQLINTAFSLGDPFSFGNGLVDAIKAINY